MTKLILGTFLFFSSISFGQVLSGDIVDEGRQVISDIPFVVEGMVAGYCIYELSVGRTGEVVSARLVDTNVKSTPAKYELRNYAFKFKFSPGTYYPKFHHARVKITSIKKERTIQK
ncbi:MAG: hypothetical protein P8N52_05880 [Crocinitomicaceae bacterium]|nr:hypothetical protein [Crocinitomicaceae bacterium]MDG1776093.1 hypothetical protein [Crocinitomicaceae bacterium]